MAIGPVQKKQLDAAIKSHGGSRNYDLRVVIGKWIVHTRETGHGYPIKVQVFHRYDPRDTLSWEIGRCDSEYTAQQRKEVFEDYLREHAMPLEPFRLLITGSRRASEPMLTMARESVQRAKGHEWHIVVGDAPGVDSEVLSACVELNVPFICFGITPEPRNPLGATNYQLIRGSFYERDEAMVEFAHRTFAIWNGQPGRNGGKSGTKYTYDHAVKQGKPADIRIFKDGKVYGKP